jgi:hypothetical protein
MGMTPRENESTLPLFVALRAASDKEKTSEAGDKICEVSVLHVCPREGGKGFWVWFGSGSWWGRRLGFVSGPAPGWVVCV